MISTMLFKTNTALYNAFWKLESCKTSYFKRWWHL